MDILNINVDLSAIDKMNNKYLDLIIHHELGYLSVSFKNGRIAVPYFLR